MCCVNFTHVASETWPRYIFPQQPPPPPHVFLPILCYRIRFLSARGRVDPPLIAWVSPRSLHVALIWPEVPVVVCLSLWPWDKLASCPGRDHAFARCPPVTPVCRRKWLSKAKRNRMKPVWYVLLCQCKVFPLQLCWSRARSLLHALLQWW